MTNIREKPQIITKLHKKKELKINLQKLTNNQIEIIIK